MSEEGNFPPEPVRRRRSPAGQALLVMLVGLLVGSLLNAERLDYTARTQPFGWQRTVAMHITAPLASVSRATGAAWLRKEISKKADNVDPPPPENTDDIQLAGDVDGSGDFPDATTTSSTTTTTAPPRIPTAADPVKVLVAGDSLMGWIGPALVSKFDGKPMTVTEDWKVATGLARPDVKNWPASLTQDMQSYDPEVVVLGFGGNDNQDMSTDQGIVHVGTKEWQQEYERRVVQVLDAVEKPGRTVYWVGLPITKRDDIERVSPMMAKAVKDELAIRPWAHYVDSRKALSPDGVYVASVPDGNGGVVKIRENDGVHPTRAGADRIVAAFAAELAKERNLDR